MGIGDWGLAQSPIPNPHFIIDNHAIFILTNNKINLKIIYKKF
jgi:hypothetical protein